MATKRGQTRAETQIDNSTSSGAEGYFVRSDGSVAMDGTLRLDDNRIIGLEDPIDPQDAVNLRTLQAYDTDIEWFDVTSNIDDSYSLAVTPVASTVRVYLNGIGPLRPGLGNDYVAVADTVMLVRPVRTDDVVVVTYRPE